MSMTKLNNLDFYYEVSGDGKIPLVLIAGLSCDSSHWTLVKDEFNKHFKVICIDNRSVGRSQVPNTAFTLNDMASDVIELLNYLHINEAHILGHSMGGAIAQIIGHKYHKMVKKLVISNSLVKIKPRTLLFMKTLSKMYFDKYPTEITFPMNAPWVFSDSLVAQAGMIDTLLTLIKEYPYPQSALGYSQQVDAIEQFDSATWVDEITTSTLIIAGSEDYLTPIDDSQLMHKAISGSKLIVKPGAHIPMLESPTEFVNDVLDFLNQV